ncbi:MAG: hypothetical protein KJ063_25215 [Anaerolineae bacterium]|nr:hypothetical protein [Anaerolineae bacterium]
MLQKFPFQDKAIVYIKECLMYGKTLSRLILEQYNIESGLVYTYLPQIDIVELPLDLEYGVLPAGLASTAFQYTASMVAKFLDQIELAYAITEDPYAKPGDAFLKDEKHQFFVFDDEVYQYSEKTTFDLRLARYQLHRGYPSNSYLLRISRGLVLTNGQMIDKKTLMQLASSVECIIIGAYDEETELIWVQQGRKPPFFDGVCVS